MLCIESRLLKYKSLNPYDTNEMHRASRTARELEKWPSQAGCAPFKMINPALLSNSSISCFVVTPLAALAKLDIAVADRGGIPTIAGGGSISMVLPFPLGTGSAPVGTGIGVLTRIVGFPPGVSSGVNDGRPLGIAS